jgi:hypothetical protein
MNRRLEQQAMRDWVVAQGYNTFCTLKFKNGYDIDERQAERVVQLFLQRVDRTYWGKRVEREQLRCQVLRSTWTRFNETCGNTSRFEQARNTTATGTYCTHEWAYLGSETFCDRLSHTASTAGARTDMNIHKLRRLLKAL